MENYFKKLIQSDEGAASAEYVIMSSLIAGVIAGAVSLLGATVLSLFSSVPSF